MLKVLRRRCVVDDHAGVAVVERPVCRPVLAANEDGLPVDDDALVVHVRLYLNVVDDVYAHALQLLEITGGLVLAHDDPHVDTGVLSVDDGLHEVDEGL